VLKNINTFLHVNQQEGSFFSKPLYHEEILRTLSSS
jgi:hypothetical protein